MPLIKLLQSNSIWKQFIVENLARQISSKGWVVHAQTYSCGFFGGYS